MDGAYPKDDKVRDTVLILPDTFFNECFLDYGKDLGSTRMRDLAWATIVGEFILIRKAFYPQLTIAATTEKAFREFKKKIEGKDRNIGALSLSSLEDAIFNNKDVGVNSLELEQSLFAVANDMYKENNQNPIIVVRPEAVEKWRTTYSDQFYAEHKDTKYKVDAYNLRETLIHIKTRYPEEYKRALANLEKLSSKYELLKMYIQMNII